MGRASDHLEVNTDAAKFHSEVARHLRPTLSEIAKWAAVSRGLTDFWRADKYQPKPADRARLVKAVRKHAARLLKLADAVEREGQERAAAARARKNTSNRDTVPQLE